MGIQAPQPTAVVTLQGWDEAGLAREVIRVSESVNQMSPMLCQMQWPPQKSPVLDFLHYLRAPGPRNSLGVSINSTHPILIILKIHRMFQDHREKGLNIVSPSGTAGSPK